MAETTTQNTLGLDFHAPSEETEDATQAEEPQSQPKGPKPKPYVNPDRVNTGGTVRERLPPEELEKRIWRMKEQNEKIRSRRKEVDKDEIAFSTKQQEEQLRDKEQRIVDVTREQNAQRKMDHVQSREWDTGKPTSDWSTQRTDEEGFSPQNFRGRAPRIRGRAGRRGRGGRGGRGRGQTNIASTAVPPKPAGDSPATNETSS